jgi:hypothetical protein
MVVAVVPLVACGGGEGGGEAPEEQVLELTEVEEPQLDWTALPWTVEGVKQAYAVGTKLSYGRSGTGSGGQEVGGTHSFLVTGASDLVVEIDDVWEDGPESNGGTSVLEWDRAVFLESFPGSPDTRFEVLGEERVETPAGTFDTVVVEVTNGFFGTRDTYWLIEDQPGVYAKWVDHGKTGDEANLVMTLESISRPGS